MKALFVLVLTGLSVYLMTNTDESNKVKISGRVSLKGQPIEDGLVILVPIPQDTNRQLVAARIAKGNYYFEPYNGPTPGDYRVEILENGQVPPDKKIPSEYNSNSKLHLNVPDDRVFYAEFEL